MDADELYRARTRTEDGKNGKMRCLGVMCDDVR